MNRIQFYSYITSLSFLLLSCSPVHIIQTSSADLRLEEDAYVRTHVDLEIAYDFWSYDGVPFISFFNVSTDTLLLDLYDSQLFFEIGNHRVQLMDALARQSAYGDLTTAYPELTFTRFKRKTYLILEPQVWASIYGPSCYSPKTVRQEGRVNYSYTYLKNDSINRLSHNFDLQTLLKVPRKEMASYERTSAGPDQYYIQKTDTATNLTTASYIAEIIVTILLLL